MEDGKSDKPKQKSSWLRSASVGPHFVVALLLGYYFGTYVDKWLGTEKIASLIGAALGLAAGFLNLFKEVAAINREEEDAYNRANQIIKSDEDSYEDSE